jgi:hypothetical protein
LNAIGKELRERQRETEETRKRLYKSPQKGIYAYVGTDRKANEVTLKGLDTSPLKSESFRMKTKPTLSRILNPA